MMVWNELLHIPYGKTTTYGLIAKQLAETKGINQMAARTIGVAVGRNPLAIFVPCHRVVDHDGSLTEHSFFCNISNRYIRGMIWII
ncbi:MAG: MGMT family protein [Erysipelotrichaceae bacterium]|nr:MGMT family protein [Erysipelotrichaceae bacterium]MDY5251230.1 MGMT family protein [Erysipelotrichaceae bacterium]